MSSVCSGVILVVLMVFTQASLSVAQQMEQERKETGSGVDLRSFSSAELAPGDGNDVNAGSADPCEKAGILFEGINGLTGLPEDFLESHEAQFLEILCFGFLCDPFPCVPPFPFHWAQYTATCTEVVTLTTHDSNGEIGSMPLVLPGGDCSIPLGYAFGNCPFHHETMSFPAIEGKGYKLAIFGGYTLTIEPLQDLSHVCEFGLPGQYVWDWHFLYDNVMAFVSCQNDCSSPTCEKCFDLDASGQIDLRDFAKFQNNFWLF